MFTTINCIHHSFNIEKIDFPVIICTILQIFIIWNWRETIFDHLTKYRFLLHKVAHNSMKFFFFSSFFNILRNKQ